MYYVYILQSEVVYDRFYVGITADLKHRIIQHNAGESVHTNKYKPWELKMYFAFRDEAKALKFEAYLKTGSGRAFTKKHF